jgi:hypothetical protein
MRCTNECVEVYGGCLRASPASAALPCNGLRAVRASKQASKQAHTHTNALEQAPPGKAVQLRLCRVLPELQQDEAAALRARCQRGHHTQEGHTHVRQLHRAADGHLSVGVQGSGRGARRRGVGRASATTCSGTTPLWHPGASKEAALAGGAPARAPPAHAHVAHEGGDEAKRLWRLTRVPQPRAHAEHRSQRLQQRGEVVLQREAQQLQRRQRAAVGLHAQHAAARRAKQARGAATSGRGALAGALLRQRHREQVARRHGRVVCAALAAGHALLHVLLAALDQPPGEVPAAVARPEAPCSLG